MVAAQLPTDRPLTLDDLDALPDDGQRYEVLQGELIVSPFAGGTHQEILGELFVLAHSAVRHDRIGKVFIAPFDVQLSHNDIVEPDLFVIRHSQMKHYTERRFAGAPAFVIEVVSPSSGTYDRVRKAALYMNAGVEEYWVVEPGQNRILIHDASRGEPMPRIVTSGTVTSAVVPSLTVDLAILFAVGPAANS